MRWRRSGWSALIAALAAGLPACDDGAPVQRGFGSHQVAQFRDPTFNFYATQGDRVYYETGRDDTGEGTATYWSLDVFTGEIKNLGAARPDFTAPPDTDRYHCDFEIDANGLTTGVFTITDTQTGMVTAIEQVYTTWPHCPTDDDPTIQVWRYEAGDSYSLWMGPFTYLVQAPLPIVVRQVLWREAGATLVSGSASGAPDGLGVFSIADQDPSVATEVIPAMLAGGAWAAGATPSTELASSGLVYPSSFWEGAPGRYNYMRAMADGSEVMFMGPYPDAPARELALFGMPVDSQMSWLRIEPYHFRYDGKWFLTPTWASVEAGVPGVTFRIWREESTRLTTCQWPVDPSPTALGDPFGENALFMRTAGMGIGLEAGLLVMVPEAPDGNSCRFLATENVGFADFSPDGTAMVWLVEPFDDKATLWTAGRDGSAPRAIGTGYIRGALYTRNEAPHFVAGSRLELTLDGDLVWIDVHDDPVRTHYIADQVFGTPIDLGRWVVTGHDYSDQDANGSLALVNRDSGERRPISAAVASYTSPDVNLYRGTPGVFNEDGRLVRIAYVVRGRNPSAQDGLWVATITKDDRQ